MQEYESRVEGVNYLKTMIAHNYNKVLVLNASYEPINICGVKRAIVMIIRGIAISEEMTSAVIRSPSLEMQIPAVIRLVAYVKLPYRKKSFSKRHIYLRDNYICQYCGVRCGHDELTLDHIVPQSRGGHSKWDNLVTACKSCNVKKGDRTPHEAAMPLRNKPRESGSIFYLSLLQFKGRGNEQWRKYLYYS